MIFSMPILEDDYFRYLWDGGVTVNGINPYSYSPEDVLNDNGVPEKLSELAGKAGGILENINNPSVRTIYPPIAQAAFALSYIIDPFNVVTWKIILLIFDLITLALLFYALRERGLPVTYLMIYWWNPLLVKEIFNSGHLDVIVFPFVLGGLILAVQNERVKSTLSMVIGIGIKLWPAFILPLINATPALPAEKARRGSACSEFNHGGFIRSGLRVGARWELGVRSLRGEVAE